VVKFGIGLIASLMLAAFTACSPTTPDRAPASETPAPETPGPPPAPPTGIALQVVDLTNAERTRAGLTAFRTSTRLGEAARIQAEQMVAAGRLEHVLPDARYPRLEDRLDAAGYRWQAAGENLAFGQPSAAAVVNTWMQSPGHRANILHTTFSEIGVAHLVDANGRPYYVQVFGRPQ
jgi:uncharacterized protein YkwD